MSVFILNTFTPPYASGRLLMLLGLVDRATIELPRGARNTRIVCPGPRHVLGRRGLENTGASVGTPQGSTAHRGHVVVAKTTRTAAVDGETDDGDEERCVQRGGVVGGTAVLHTGGGINERYNAPSRCCAVGR